jgi:hypothetical protein
VKTFGSPHREGLTMRDADPAERISARPSAGPGPRVTAAERVWGERWHGHWCARADCLTEAGLDPVEARARAAAELEDIASGILKARGASAALPWRAAVRDWPEAKREAWGLLAAEYEGRGLSWRDAESRAFDDLTRGPGGAPFDPAPPDPLRSADAPAPAAPPPRHPVPETLAEWLAGWVTASTGNPTLALGADRYTVFPCRFRPGAWSAAAGRSFLKPTWPDPESAKAGLYHHVKGLTPDRMDALHRAPVGRPRKIPNEG